MQLAIFGRPLDGRSDALPGYKLALLKITDADVIAKSGADEHMIGRRTSDPLDKVPGLVFPITEAELAAADAYEVADCKRVTVKLESGLDAFVYVSADEG